MRRSALLVSLLFAAALVGVELPAAAEGPCSGAAPDGGEWPMYGRDLWGTRNQPAEDLLSPSTVGDLSLAWSTSGNVQTGISTAVVAGNCVYVAGSGNGTITALRVSDGAVVWQRPSSSYADKTQSAALAVANGRVYANVSEGDGSRDPDAAPVGVSLDMDTGDILSESRPIQFGEPTTAYAGAIVFGGLQLVVSNGGDGIPDARPGFALLDASDGTVLTDRTTIPVADLDKGYAGGGQWATPVVDLATGYAFNGTANPYSKQKEHRYDNAIIKIDVDPASPTFGEVVDAYKGNVDQYFPGLDRQPLCDEFGDDIGYHPCCNFSVTCVQLDIDFGASPTMWRTTDGDLMVGALQKSGVFHAVYAETMQSAWTTLLSTLPPATAGNASSAATDGERIYVVANGGVLYALDPATGRIRWATHTADIGGYHPVSVANGVVYLLTHHGTLMAFDASNGRPLLARNMPADAQTFCFTLGGGVSIAAHTVFVNCDGTLFAYRVAS